MSNAVGSPRTPVVLELGKQKLRVSANVDPAHLERLATMVNERFDVMARSTRNSIPSTLLALVALDLADELLAAQTRLGTQQEDTQKKLEAELARVREESVQAAAVADARIRAMEARVREVEARAIRAVTEALAEVDRALAEGAALEVAEQAADTTLTNHNA